MKRPLLYGRYRPGVGWQFLAPPLPVGMHIVLAWPPPSRRG